MPPALTVIIPTYNESGVISPTIRSLFSRATRPPHILVVDGGSRDATRAEAAAAGAKVFHVSGGRAAQLNAGAAAAGSGDTLLFLHADTLPPVGYDVEVEEVLTREGDGGGWLRRFRRRRKGAGVVGGAWRLGIKGKGWQLRVVERWVNFRSRVLGMPYGDQGLFMRKSTFVNVGGYTDMPLMEDYDMSMRLRDEGDLRIARGSVTTCGRRWETLGVFKTTLINHCIVCGYHAGIPVERLAKWYRGTLRRAEEKKTLRERRKAG